MSNEYDTDYINIPNNPTCDNCSKPITGFGIHVVKGGIVIFVHQTYNRQTGKCD